jgi:hypothetical protein
VRNECALLLALIAFSLTSAQAVDDARAQLAAARSLTCHFGPGTEARWKGNKPAVRSARFDENIQFDSIDLGKESARAIGNNGAVDVHVLNTAVGLSFLETAPAVLDITTFFAIYTKNNAFPAVDSRHVMVLGTAMAEQFDGTCILRHM